MHEGDAFSARDPSEKANFICQLTGLAMVWPASSDKCNALYDTKFVIGFTGNLYKSHARQC